MFRDWAGLLPPSVALEAVVLPGREGRFREPPYERMAPLVDDLVAALAPRLDRPYALLGYSMGAQVAFNLAHGLGSAGLPLPIRLFVAASPGPSERYVVRGWDEPDEGLVAYLRDMGGTPPDVFDNPDLLELMLPTLRADLTVVATWPYRRRPPLPVPIHAFSGADDTTASPALMASWREETDDRFEQTVLPGGHFFVATELPALAAAVGDNLVPAPVE